MFVYTLLMALATGFGTIPFLVFGKLSATWSGVSHALASGVMLAASFDLIHEGGPYGGTSVIFGILAGALFIQYVQNSLHKYEDISFADLKGADAHRMLLIIGIMTAHSFAEGAGVGVSFSGNRGWVEGILVTLAIGIHNIPEGLAVATVLIGRGMSPKQAACWSVLTSLPQPFIAVPSFLFVETFRSCLPLAMGFAAGCMIWMVFAELVPASLAEVSASTTATCTTFAAAVLECFRLAMASLETPDGRMTPPVNEEQLPALGAIVVSPLPLISVALFFVSFISLVQLSRPVSQILSLGMSGGILLALGVSDILEELGGPFSMVSSTLLLLFGYFAFSSLVNWLDTHMELLYRHCSHAKLKDDQQLDAGHQRSADMVSIVVGSLNEVHPGTHRSIDSSVKDCDSRCLAEACTQEDIPHWRDRIMRAELPLFRAAIVGLMGLVCNSFFDGIFLGRAMRNLQNNPMQMLAAAAVADIPKGVAAAMLAILLRRMGRRQVWAVGMASLAGFVEITVGFLVLAGWDLGTSTAGVKIVHCLVAGSLVATSSQLIPLTSQKGHGAAHLRYVSFMGVSLVLLVHMSLRALCHWTPYCLDRKSVV